MIANLNRLRWAFALFMLLMMSNHVISQTPSGEQTYAIALHGGAGALPKDLPAETVEAYRESLTRALQSGVDILQRGGSSLDAVSATVMVLEDAPLFNAGKGAVFNSAGSHELDASIMDGSTHEGGGVAGVTRIKNPILAARCVMDDKHHVLLAGEQANVFAENAGCSTVDQHYFYTARRWNQLIKKMKAMKLEPPSAPSYAIPSSFVEGSSTEGDSGETVGCVALDMKGHLAAATSTGGRTAKRFGRIGDSPILGAGTYADDNTAAVSGTGIGEEYIRYTIAARVCLRMELADDDLESACRHCLDKVLKPGDGGLIAVDHNGNLFLGTSTPAMARAWAHSDGRREIAIWEDPLRD